MMRVILFGASVWAALAAPCCAAAEAAASAPVAGRLKADVPRLSDPITNFSNVAGTRESGDSMVVEPRLSTMNTAAFKARDAEIQKMRLQLRESAPGKNGMSETSKLRHVELQDAADSLARANKAFELNAMKMSPRRRALAELQVDITTQHLQAATVNQKLAVAQLFGTKDPSAVMAAQTEAFAHALSLPPRKLRVLVRPAGTHQSAESMDVYVLPIGVAEYGAATEQSKIRNLIEVLKFSTPTSPAEGELEPGFTYAVWIGQRNAADKMAELVHKAAVHYRPVDASRELLGDLTFDESEQVHAP